MKNHIDPVTLQKLDEFNKRRNRLLGFRGLCAFIISTVAIFSIMAAIDSYVLLADGLRGFLTFAGWITVAGLCLLYTSPSPRDKRQSRMPSSA